jgi:hypothetical protein
MKSKSAGAAAPGGVQGGTGIEARRRAAPTARIECQIPFSHSPFPWTLNECHEHDIDNRMLIHVTRVQRPDPLLRLESDRAGAAGSV